MLRRRPTARRLPTAALGALLLGVWPPTSGAAQAPDRSLSRERVAAQVAAGALGPPVGFLTAGILTDRVFERLGRDDPTTSRIALAAAWTGAALATGAGPALVGARGPGRGSYPAAVGGAALGGLASWAIVRLVDRDGEHPPRGGRLGAAAAAIAVFLLPGAGATAAYNASR
jgi:hypothetical protein